MPFTAASAGKRAMKALSLTQPWATLVTIGAKKIETRSWRCNYRGELAIHAAKSFPRDCRDLTRDPPFSDALREAGYAGYETLPVGAIIAVCELYDCLPTTAIRRQIDGIEYEFGNYADGRFAFLLRNVSILAQPVLIKGALGLWEWPGCPSAGAAAGRR
jgi:hypothetical protein